MLGLRLNRSRRRRGWLGRLIRLNGRAWIVGDGLWGLLNVRWRRLLNGHRRRDRIDWLLDRRRGRHWRNGRLRRSGHGIYAHRVGASLLEVNPHADIRDSRAVPPAQRGERVAEAVIAKNRALSSRARDVRYRALHGSSFSV